MYVLPITETFRFSAQPILLVFAFQCICGMSVFQDTHILKVAIVSFTESSFKLPQPMWVLTCHSIWYKASKAVSLRRTPRLYEYTTS